MRLSVKALAISLGILWGGCLFVVGILNLAAPAYGGDFLRLMGSIYPGFFHAHNFGNVLLGTAYGFVDGLIGGWLAAWLYNCFVKPKQQSETARLNRAA